MLSYKFTEELKNRKCILLDQSMLHSSIYLIADPQYFCIQLFLSL